MIAIGCGDRVTLSSENGLDLTYSCDDIAAHATDSASIELVRAAARDLLDVAGRDGSSAWGARIEAQRDQKDVRQLERGVVLYMCDSGVRPFRGTGVEFPDSGSAAPAFDLRVAIAEPSVALEYVSLENEVGNIVLLDFWASWCIPCLGKQPYIADLAAKYAARGLRVYGVLVSDRTFEAERWLRSEGRLTYPFLADPTGSVAQAYGVNGIPRMFLIGRDGRLLAHCFGCAGGSMAPGRLDVWIDSLLGTADNIESS